MLIQIICFCIQVACIIIFIQKIKTNEHRPINDNATQGNRVASTIHLQEMLNHIDDKAFKELIFKRIERGINQEVYNFLDNIPNDYLKYLSDKAKDKTEKVEEEKTKSQISKLQWIQKN